MLRLSWNTFRESWQLFLGSILTVAIGVALVQSSLLNLITAATVTAPAGLSTLERARLLDSYGLAIPVIGITLALALFLTIFIVSSTFAFTVAQRKRDLALLRLTGGSREQVRRLLLSEAAILGAVGTLLGIPFGLLVMRLQTNLLIFFGFLPEGFQPAWHTWILAVSVGIGLAVALAGVMVASRRASRVRPLEALRGTGDDARVMTGSRWFFGIGFLGIAVALLIIAQGVDPGGAMPLMLLVTLAAAVGLSALSPLVVPFFGRLLGLFLRDRPTGTLAAANMREGVRRNAATAAPLIVLVGLLVGLLGTSLSTSAAAELTLRRDTAADLVVTSSASSADRIDDVSGVTGASVEIDVPLVMTNVAHDADAVGGALQAGQGRAVDPSDYQQVHQVPVEAGSLADLQGEAVALAPGRSGEWGYSIGDTIEMEIGGEELQLPIVAVLPTTAYGGPDLLLPEGIVPDSVLASASAQTFVTTQDGVGSGAVGEEIAGTVPGSVTGVETWVSEHADAQQNAQLKIFTVLLGMSSLYALFAAINAVVIAASDRRGEFAAARLSGLTRRQVVRMAVMESTAVTAVGILLGGLTASGTILGMRSALQRMTGVGIVELPWLIILALVASAFAVVGITSWQAAHSATRMNPVSLVTDA